MIIGLTGGIASGKSAVSAYLTSLKIPIVDADIVARQVVKPGTRGLTLLVEAFGDSILKDKALDRRALRNIIFSDEPKRLLVNAILHPIIHEEIVHQLNHYKVLNHPIIIFDAPLLLENKLEHMVDVLWVVACDEKVQISRVKKRDGITEEEALKIINRQMPLQEKMDKADVVLTNNTTLDALYNQIDYQLKIAVR